MAIFLLPVAILALQRWRCYRKSQNLIIRSVADRTDLLEAVDRAYRYQIVLILDFQMTVCIDIKPIEYWIYRKQLTKYIDIRQ